MSAGPVGRERLDLDVWPGDGRDEFAVRADLATVEEARAAVEREYAPVEYIGIRVVNLPEREGLRGRRRRAHIFGGRPCGPDWFCGSCADCLANPDPENLPRGTRP